MIFIYFYGKTIVDDERIMLSSVYARLSSKFLIEFTQFRSCEIHVSYSKQVCFMTGKVRTHDEHSIHTTNELVALHKTDTVLKPPDATLLKKMRDTKLQQLKIQASIRDFFFYCCFSLLVFCLAYTTQGNSKYFQSLDIEKLFNPQFRSNSGSNMQVLIFGNLR